MPEKIVRHVLEEPSGRGPFQFSVGSEIPVAGWAFVDPGTTPSTALEIVSRQSGAAVRITRDEVDGPMWRRHFRATSLEMSGFAGTLRIEPQFQGENQVRLLQIEQPGLVHAVDLFSFTVVSDGVRNARARRPRRQVPARIRARDWSAPAAAPDAGPLQGHLRRPDAAGGSPSSLSRASGSADSEAGSDRRRGDARAGRVPNHRISSSPIIFSSTARTRLKRS